MFPISSFTRVIIWIITGIASFTFAILLIVLEPRIARVVRKRGRPPAKRTIKTWIIFWTAAITMILGTAIASSAPEKTIGEIKPIIIPPTNSLDDYKDEILSLYPPEYEDFLELNSANLDDYGKQEIIVSQSHSNRPPKFFIDVFAYIANNNKWQKILHLEDAEACGLSFGLINLKKDTTRQVVIYQHCGSGSFVHLWIYKYRGLQFAEEIEFSIPDNQESFSHSVVNIIDEELYINSYLNNSSYHFLWDGSSLIVEKFDLVLPPNTVKVLYWRNENTVVFEPASLEVEVGTFIYFIHDEQKDTDYCQGDTYYASKEILAFTEYPNLIATHANGKDTISIVCKFQPVSNTITIVVK